MKDTQGAILAIDPGFSGAIALYDHASGSLEIEDIPLVVSKTRKHRLDLEKFCKTLDVVSAFADTCVVEQVASMPRQAGMFSFGYCCGVIDMAAVANGFRLVKVPAAKWKLGAGIVRSITDNSRKNRKAASLRRALEVFPAHAHFFQRAKDDGRAEAALIAWWYALTRAPAVALGQAA